MIAPTPHVTESGNTYQARPPRWPVRLFNGLARVKQRVSRPSDPIDAERILNIAREKTGLEDFGAERAREGLEHLAQSLDKEARLHPFGRFMHFGRLVDQISNRLRIIDYLKQKPEIGEAKLRRPLLVTGFGRSGTSLLHNLLAQDPRSRPLMAWEASCPVNPAYRDANAGDTRLPLLKRQFRGANYLAPELKTLHALHADRPEECIEFLQLSFVSTSFGVHARIPGYTKWLGAQPPEAWREAYAFYRSQLQIVQHDGPEGHLALKCPVHYRHLDVYLETIENASVVITHRNPVEMLPSACSLAAVFRGLTSDPEDPNKLGADVLQSHEHLQHKVLERMESLPRQRICDVRYPDLVANPLETVRRIYEHLGYTYSDEMQERMKRWLSENPKNKHGQHRYRAEQFGLTNEQIREAMKPYCERFDV